MDRFNVWIQPFENSCGVRVDSLENAEWLLNSLSQSFVFKSSEPMNESRFFSLLHLSCALQFPNIQGQVCKTAGRYPRGETDVGLAIKNLIGGKNVDLDFEYVPLSPGRVSCKRLASN